MRRILSIILTLIPALLPIASQAESHTFPMLRYGINDGLSHNTVRCVVQDSYGFMWFGTADGLNRFDGRSYKVFHGSEADTTSLGNNSIHSLYADAGGDLWVGTGNGVYIYRHERNTFSRFAVRTDHDVSIHTQVNAITDDGDRLWIGTQGQGVFIYDRRNNLLRQSSLHASVVTVINKTPGGNIYIGSEVGTISELTCEAELVRTLISDRSTGEQRNREITAMRLQGDTIWFTVGINGLQRLVRNESGAMTVEPDNPQARLNVTSIFLYEDKTLLVGTDNGLYTLDTETMNYARVMDETFPSRYYNQHINDIYRDSEGGIWIATQYGGVNYLPRKLKTFNLDLSANSPGKSGAMIVNSFCRDAAGNIWVGTWNGGLIYLDGKTGKNIISPQHRHARIMNIQSLMLDGNDLWIGTYAQGVYVLDLRSGKLDNYRHYRDKDSSISDNSVNVIYRDSRGTIYVGTKWGLNRYNPATAGFSFESRANNQADISDILEDSHGYVWFSSGNTGLFRYGPERNSWVAYRHKRSDPNSLVSDHVTCLFEDSKGRVWAGTEVGLCYFDHEEKRFVRFAPTNMVIPDQTVSSIEQDTNGALWVAGNTGLLCLDIDNNLVVNQFSQIDGLQSNQFNYRSSMMAADGKLYFGGINGFNSFYPGEFQNNVHPPKILITGIRINNREITPDKPSSPLDRAIYVTDAVKLSSKQNSLSFDFSSMSYQSPAKNLFTYKLEGWDEEWSRPDSRGEAIYSNLPPGKYRFMVNGSNNDGLWGEGRSVEIIIRPPFYSTTIAYLLYFIIIFTSLVSVAMTMNRRYQRRMTEYAREQEKKNYRAKIELFTSLTHEIRTPLTLIKVPLENIIFSGDGNARTRNYLEIMNRNADNLLNLINQLLDLHKSERTEYELTLVPCDIGALVNEACMRFKPALQIKDIDIDLSIPTEPAIYNVDTDAMAKVVNNLISNAAKYAAGEIKISLTDSGDSFTLTVKDDGPGIEPSQQEKIFEAFYQSEGSKAGTGIGLPLAKALAEKHSGRISVKSGEGQGAEFTVFIPRLDASMITVTHTTDVADVQSRNVSDISEEGEFSVADKGVTVLVVEDNDELRGMLADIIGQRYSALTARHGKEALEVLNTNGADIIVSDIMMPEMDGYQLAEFVKSDMRYSHIPIIQLTAKTSIEDRIKGLKYGSDAYIEKPFSSEHLLSQIDNLLENRRRLQKAYNATLYESPGALIAGSNEEDNKFIEKLNREIERNIQNENFYIDTLAESLCMSRSNFYRKIKSLFGVSPNEYLRRCRLKKAAEMLRTGKYRASDVYILVGFSSLSYFSTCFKNYYGVSPVKLRSGDKIL